MNRYQVGAGVGEGAYGCVFKAFDTQNQKMVAIKKFKETEDDDPETLEYVNRAINREITLCRKVSHPHVIELVDSFSDAGVLHLVFELMSKNLLDLMEANPTGMDRELVRRLTYQLTLSIDAVHKASVVHRDIKPENLLLTEDNSVMKLCDFGVARPAIVPSRPRSHGARRKIGNDLMTNYVGSRWYRAPEMMLDATDYGKAVDVWAIGCIMAEMVTGQALFQGDDEVQQLHIFTSKLGPAPPSLLLFAGGRGVKLPRPSHSPTLAAEMRGLDPTALSFMQASLQMDPARRPTAAALLNHPYLRPVHLKAQSQQPKPTANPQQPATRPGRGAGPGPGGTHTGSVASASHVNAAAVDEVEDDELVMEEEEVGGGGGG